MTLNCRVGINTGMCVGGLVGTVDRLGYTVHGDNVNLAARLEQLNKEYGTRIIVSEATAELAGWERFAFERIGEVQVRGRKTATVIYTVSPLQLKSAP
ncbi:MAG: adenylate/guanylate cyclase domain-containing protein [Proteobacteria bacterium]|nr:MAG: adenylate/guanylate cyclase domain-containing protein [Pseudomonadota bacterium]